MAVNSIQVSKTTGSELFIAYNKKQQTEQTSHSRPNSDSSLVAVYEKSSKKRTSWEVHTYTHPALTKAADHSAVGLAQTIYENWKQSLTDASAEYMDDFHQYLEDYHGEITDEQKREFKESLKDWLAEQRAALNTALQDSPPGIVKKIMEEAREVLASVKKVMWKTMR